MTPPRFTRDAPSAKTTWIEAIGRLRRAWAHLLHAIAYGIEERTPAPPDVMEVDGDGLGWLIGAKRDLNPIAILRAAPGFTIVATSELDLVLKWAHGADSVEVEYTDEIGDAMTYLEERVRSSK